MSAKILAYLSHPAAFPRSRTPLYLLYVILSYSLASIAFRLVRNINALGKPELSEGLVWGAYGLDISAPAETEYLHFVCTPFASAFLWAGSAAKRLLECNKVLITRVRLYELCGKKMKLQKTN